jgi:transposase
MIKCLRVLILNNKEAPMKFKTGEPRDQATFMPSTIDEYIPDNHLAKLLWTLVGFLNLDKIIAKYSETGQNAFSPKILVVILFYGYAIGMRSSRKLSQACIDRLDFIYLTAKLKPSYKTISEFRRENLDELTVLFQEIVLIGVKLGLVKIGNIKVSIDGTKVRANASGKLSKDEEGLKKLLSEVEEKVGAILKEAEAEDIKEDLAAEANSQGVEIPAELEKLSAKKVKIEQAISELKEEKARLKEELIDKKSKNGKVGKLTQKEEAKIEKTKLNLTDPDAKYMKEREGTIKTNYNGQASVDEKEQFILANDVTDECNDKKQLVPMLEKTEENLESNVDAVKADSGYHSSENLKAVSEKGIDAYIDDSTKQRIDNENYKYDKVNFKYDAETDSYTCPEGNRMEKTSEKNGESIYECNSCSSCPAKASCTKAKNKKLTRGKNESIVEENREKILSEEGQKEYKKRMHTVEPVFGNLKFNLGFRQFLLRGLTKVKGEFNLMCIAHNLKKIASYCIKNEIDLRLCLT